MGGGCVRLETVNHPAQPPATTITSTSDWHWWDENAEKKKCQFHYKGADLTLSVPFYSPAWIIGINLCVANLDSLGFYYTLHHCLPKERLPVSHLGWDRGDFSRWGGNKNKLGVRYLPGAVLSPQPEECQHGLQGLTIHCTLHYTFPFVTRMNHHRQIASRETQAEWWQEIRITDSLLRTGRTRPHSKLNRTLWLDVLWPHQLETDRSIRFEAA